MNRGQQLKLVERLLLTDLVELQSVSKELVRNQRADDRRNRRRMRVAGPHKSIV